MLEITLPAPISAIAASRFSRSSWLSEQATGLSSVIFVSSGAQGLAVSVDPEPRFRSREGIVIAEATLSIGDVAGRAGVNVSTVRFYERRGLLPEPERVSGQRRYTTTVVHRIRIIATAKQAGFSLDEVGVLLASTDLGVPAHEQLRALAARKLPEVDGLIQRAQAMRGWLIAASACGCDTLDSCALFDGSIDG
ncbi:MAG TPA: MerR family transcriptional regulator [Solirubrobacterales bacterium]